MKLKHSKKFHRLVEQSKQIGRASEFDKKYKFVSSCLMSAVSDEIKALIDVHLKRIASLHTNLGIDSNDSERRLIKNLEQHEMYKIKLINLRYYNSIKPNDN